MNLPRIAIVEDDPFYATLFQKVLAENNYTALKPTTNFSDAIMMLDKERPDLVILDVIIDDANKNGIDIARHIRKHYDIPCVFISSVSSKETINEIDKITPGSFLAKPFNEKTFIDIIERGLCNFKGKSRPPGTIKLNIMIDDVQCLQLNFDIILGEG